MVLRRITGKRPTDLILTSRGGGRWHYTNFHDRVWSRPANRKNDVAPNKPRILERARELGLERPVTGHCLRHTDVFGLILSGEPLTAIQRRLGHASITTTSDTDAQMIEDASSVGLARAAALYGVGQVAVSAELEQNAAQPADA